MLSCKLMYLLLIYLLLLLNSLVAANLIDDSLCSIVAATNIGSLKTYEQWNCTLGIANTDPCTWNGVECNNTEVNSVILSGISLKGSIPSGIFLLTTLSTLDVSDNRLTGIYSLLLLY